MSLFAASCDPCFGTAACGASGPRLAIDGQLVRAEDGRGVDGIQVDVFRVGGVAITSDSLSATTTDGGFWHVDVPAVAAGDVIIDVRVSTPELAHPYVVRGVRVATVDRKGDARMLERWVTNPYFPYFVELFWRAAPSQLIAGTPVDFRPRSGPSVRGVLVSDTLVHTQTDSYGRAQVFLYGAQPTDTGDVIGDFIVRLPPPYQPSIIPRVALRPTYLYRAPAIVPRFGVGPNLDYLLVVYDRATGRVVPGVGFDFRWVGGIDVAPRTFSGVVDNFGYAHLQTRPLSTGSVIADITVQPPVGSPETIRDTLPTFDADGGRVLKNLSVGAVLPYYGIVGASGRVLPNVPVRVRRTAGIDVSPADTTMTTLANGVLLLSLRPLAAGSVTLELTFSPPAPYPRFMIKNLVISTLQRDTQGINVWTWELEKTPTGPPGTEVVILP